MLQLVRGGALFNTSGPNGFVFLMATIAHGLGFRLHPKANIILFYMNDASLVS